MEKYYTPEQMAQFEELRAETPPEEIKTAELEWASLLAEVRASRGLDPASAEAKALAARWDALQERTMAHFAAQAGAGGSDGPQLRSGKL